MAFPWRGSYAARILAILIAIAAVVPFTTGAAAPQLDVSATIEPASVAPGDDVDIAVQLDNANSERGLVVIYGFINDPANHLIERLTWHQFLRGQGSVTGTREFDLPASAQPGTYTLSVLVWGIGVFEYEDDVATFTVSDGTQAPATPTEAPATPTEPAGSTELDQVEAEFLSLLNQYRADNGLAPLTRNPALDLAAERHSADMAAREYFSHDTPEGVTPWTRMAEAGYTCESYKGENIAAGYATAEAVFNGWRNSPGHDANMLNQYFAEIGIGLVYDADSPYGYYWTTDFGLCVG